MNSKERANEILTSSPMMRTLLNAGYYDANAENLGPLNTFIEQLLHEEAAITELSKREVPDYLLQTVGAIWVPSGPGFIKEPYKNDRYKDKEWAAFMGRKRLMYGVYLMRRVAEARSGTVLPYDINDPIESRRRINSLITESGPQLLFNGRSDENQDVLHYLRDEHDIIVPASRVTVITGEIDNTAQQVQNLHGANMQAEFQNLIARDQSLAIVTHVPHAVRLLHILGMNNPFPEDLNIQLLPVKREIPEYELDEICGTIYYILAQQASREMYLPANVILS